MTNSGISRRTFLKSAAMATAAIAAGAAGAGEPAHAAAQWVRKGKRVKSLAGFDTMMIDFMAERNIRNGSLAITKDGKLMLARAYSQTANAANAIMPNSLFRIASISKPITAVAGLRMAQDGLINLDMPLTSYVPLTPLEGQTADPRLATVTIRQLLQHSGGWDRGISFDPMFYDVQVAAALNKALPVTGKNIIRYMSGRTLDFDPGTQYAYSNYGYLLLEQLFKPLTDMEYGKYVRTNVLKPLGIKRPRLGRTARANRWPGEVNYFSSHKDRTVLNNSGNFVKAPYGGFNLENMKAHGGWVASAVDLVRFASAFDNRDTSPLLSADSINTMFGVPATGINTGGSWYGCGWSVRSAGSGLLNTWHFGSLRGTYTGLIRRNDGLNWAFLFNRREEGSQNFGAIDSLMHQAANSITDWPTHDLFSLYL